MPPKLDVGAFIGFVAAFKKMCDMHSDFVQKFDASLQKVDVHNADSVTRYDSLLGGIVELRLRFQLLLMFLAQLMSPTSVT